MATNIHTRLFFLLTILATACTTKKGDTLFIKLDPGSSGIVFENTIEESPAINILSYEYTYNGGGVAAADFNNDGWCDLYFTGNAVSNRLYINTQNLGFKDITAKAGVGGRALWKTGVTAADVNADGWLDLYVCYSGPEINQSRSNELYINNGCEKGGEPTFTERAKEYGLDAPETYSTQASFFDYDRDGDLDMFLINHGNHFYSPFINTNELRETRHPQFGNRLYCNDTRAAEGSAAQPYFTESSQEAGIHGGGLNFGLGVSISDLNGDGWPDIYVTNDYEEQDFLYLNTKDGKFKECTKQSLGHLSRNGMGTDIADFNNDGRPDLIEVDMWPEDNYRQKLLRGPDDYNRYMLMVDSGFHNQQMRNTLQLNAGVTAEGLPFFCETGQLSGVSATDWSWAPLFADLDNDGFKDLFITNGYLRDFTSMDFLKYTVEEARKKAAQEGKELQLYELISKMPSTKTSDYVFRNNGNLTFSDNTKAWGLDLPNLSFGAAYADLDNDGDLELITNNTNEPASVWINQSERAEHKNYLRVRLSGSQANRYGIGAKVIVETDAGKQWQEQYLTRGYQSSVEPILHFGLGKNTGVKRVVVIWPDGKQSVQSTTAGNQLIEIAYTTSSVPSDPPAEIQRSFFQDVSDESKISFVHRENSFIDYDREPLVPYQLSRLGPALASGDVSGDGFDDFYVGGAAGQSGQLYVSDGRGHFKPASQQPWEEDSLHEDSGATFFDADGDGDLDLFIVSGGNEFPQGSDLLDDRLYVNEGKGKFKRAPAGSIIEDHASGSCVTAADFDKDGDVDLYIGGRLQSGKFPETGPGAILRNDSDRATHELRFTVATKEVCAALREPGMVTDARWTDFNADGWPDLIVVGDWMPVRLFENKKGKLAEIQSPSLKNSGGFWNRIESFDFDNDGDLDYVLGNSGSNLPWKISEQQPLLLYTADFNSDNRIDPIVCYTSNGKQYPVASRDEMLSQVSALRKKFTSYASYAGAAIQDVFEKPSLDAAQKLKISTVMTSVLENLGGGDFSLAALPLKAQVSSCSGILAGDYNNDGFSDILLAGNFYPNRTQYGRNDAGIGLLMLGDGEGRFNAVAWESSGFLALGDIRNMVRLKGEEGRTFIIIARNNDRMSLIESKKHEQKTDK